MEEPLVNIMMPVYNGMPLLKASIASILQQTYYNWQCVIYNDGSTDATSEYLQTIKGDQRFLIMSDTVNRGRGYSRQQILEASTGTYICMLDAGDLMHPDRIRLQVEYMEGHPHVGLLSTGILSFGLHTNLMLARGWDGTSTFNGNNYPCYAPSMMRMYIASQCHYNPKLNVGEDTDFFNQYFALNPLYASIPQLLYYYDELEQRSKWTLTTGYIGNTLIALRFHHYFQAFTYFLKVIYSLSVIPFMSWENIYKRRGQEATESERAEFIRNTNIIQ